MDRESFVHAIRRVVQDRAAIDVISVLTRPPGRKPDADLLALSAWFDSLPLDDRKNLEQVINMAARFATFGFLCVLDGAVAVEDGRTKGTLDLRYHRDALDISLNDDTGELLHDLL